MKFIVILTSFFLLSLGYSQSYFDASTEEFFKLKQVNDTIDFKNFDADLLAAAIFHQTNLQRKNRGRLNYNEQLAKAAQYHTEQMVEKHFFDHTNRYEKTMKTPEKRAKHFGFPSSFVGENIVEEFCLNYRDNTNYNYKEGKFYNGNYSKEIVPLTYKELAERTVSRWMHSSGHKQNILLKEYTLLGIGVELAPVKEGELPYIVATQVFGVKL